MVMMSGYCTKVMCIIPIQHAHIEVMCIIVLNIHTPILNHGTTMSYNMYQLYIDLHILTHVITVRCVSVNGLPPDVFLKDTLVS